MNKKNMHFSFSALICSYLNMSRLRLVVLAFSVLICSGQLDKWLIKLPHWRVNIIITRACQQMDFWNIMRTASHRKKVILKNGGV